MVKYIRCIVGLLLFIVLFKVTKEHIWIGTRSFVFPINIFSEKQNNILSLVLFIGLASIPFIWSRIRLRMGIFITVAPILYILFRTIFHFRQFAAGASGTTEMLSLLFFLASMAYIIPLVRWIFLITENPIRTIAEVIFVVNVAYLLCVSIQVFVDPGPMYNGNRFYGLSNHPNQFAANLALLNTGALFFLFRSFIHSNNALRGRLISIALILGNYGFVIVTGSRTGIATILISTIPFIVVLFFRRPLATIIISFFVFSLIIGVFMFVSTTSFDVYRIFSTLNTRDYIFSELWQGFVENPIIGVPYVETHTSNSYLMALANVGIVGGIPFFAFLALDFCYNVKINFMGNISPRGKLETSFLSSAFLGIIALGFLDGFFLQVISFSQLFAIMFVVARCCYIEDIQNRLMQFRRQSGNYNRPASLRVSNASLGSNQI